MISRIKILFLISATIPFARCPAQKDTVYYNYTIDEVTLTEHRNVSAISGTMVQGIRIDSKKMETYPKLFGYTDPMQYIQSLPGVSTINGCESGMHVQGGETSHNLIMLSDVPVYSVTHLVVPALSSQTSSRESRNKKYFIKNGLFCMIWPFFFSWQQDGQENYLSGFYQSML